MAPRGELPGWVNLGLLPLLNLGAAFPVSGLIESTALQVRPPSVVL